MCKSLKKACNTSKSCLHLNIWKSHIFRYLCYSIRWMYNRFFSVTSLETTNVKPGGVEKKSRYLKICQEILQTSYNTDIFTQWCCCMNKIWSLIDCILLFKYNILPSLLAFIFAECPSPPSRPLSCSFYLILLSPLYSFSVLPLNCSYSSVLSFFFLPTHFHFLFICKRKSFIQAAQS